MKQNRIKWVITAILFLLHLFWWVMPSNIAYLIAQDRDILLGRYSLDRFTAMIFGLLLTWPVLYAAKSGHRLYNLGMSEGTHSNYVEICRK